MWMIVKVLAADLVILDNNDKVKFPTRRGHPVRGSPGGDAVAMEHAPGSRAIIGIMATGGTDGSTGAWLDADGGHRSTLTGAVARR